MPYITFRDQLLLCFRYLGTKSTIDVALSGRSLDEAVVINAGEAIKHTHPSFEQTGSVGFDSLRGASPSFGGDNLFIEFPVASIFSQPDNTDWLGVHLVPYPFSKKSVLFTQKMGPLPTSLFDWQSIFGLIIYRSIGTEITTLAAGMLIGLDPEGLVSNPYLFPVTGDLSTLDGMKEDSFRVTAMIGYQVFLCFSLVNSGKITAVKKIEAGKPAQYTLSYRSKLNG
jgi:hypothetical protein